MPEETDLPYHPKEERRRSKRIRQAKVPWLSECIQSFCIRSVFPRAEALCERCREEVDVRESQSTKQSMKGLDRERPIRQRLESRRCVRQEIFLR